MITTKKIMKIIESEATSLSVGDTVTYTKRFIDTGNDKSLVDLQGIVQKINWNDDVTVKWNNEVTKTIHGYNLVSIKS